MIKRFIRQIVIVSVKFYAYEIFSTGLYIYLYVYFVLFFSYVQAKDLFVRNVILMTSSSPLTITSSVASVKPLFTSTKNLFCSIFYESQIFKSRISRTEIILSTNIHSLYRCITKFHRLKAKHSDHIFLFFEY